MQADLKTHSKNFQTILSGETSDIKNLQIQNKILCAIYDDEKNNWKSVDYNKKKEIVETA